MYSMLHSRLKLILQDTSHTLLAKSKWRHWVITKSAMGSMSGMAAYKNSTAISNSNHLKLPNDPRTITEIAKFLNSYVTR
jgi:hypothetical protein